MYTMTIVLYDEDLLNKILSIMIEFQLFDSTILDGETPENLAVETLPFLAELAALLEGDSRFNKTIICNVESLEQVKDFVDVCLEEGIDFKQENTGWVSAVKNDFFIGV